MSAKIPIVHYEVKRLTFLLSVVTYMLLGVTGCKTTGRHVQWFEGPPAKTNTVALLKVERDGKVILTVDKIDGQPLTKGKHINNVASEIVLLPGKYDLYISYRDSAGNRSSADAIICRVAEKGKSYQLCGAPLERSFGKAFWQGLSWQHWYWTLWIVDLESKKIIAGEPRGTPLHWYE